MTGPNDVADKTVKTAPSKSDQYVRDLRAVLQGQEPAYLAGKESAPAPKKEDMTFFDPGRGGVVV